MVFGGYNWLSLAFWLSISGLAILFSYFILMSVGGRWDKNIMVGYKLSAYGLFFLWVIIWLFDAASIFIFWSFSIHHVVISGVTLVQDNAPGVNYGIFNSVLIFYLLSCGTYIFWVTYYWSKHFGSAGKNAGNFAILGVLWLFSALTFSLMFSICSAAGSSRGICWLPGVLYIPHMLLTSYLFILSIRICLYEDGREEISIEPCEDKE